VCGLEFWLGWGWYRGFGLGLGLERNIVVMIVDKNVAGMRMDGLGVEVIFFYILVCLCVYVWMFYIGVDFKKRCMPQGRGEREGRSEK
jgi:hypothetical protein